MTNKDNGGPAFPGKRVVKDAAWEASREVFTSGMTLRDYFAAKALQGILSCTRDYQNGEDLRSRVSLSYKYADAMLEARK